MLMAKKHTSLYLDPQLMADAERLLGTSGTTATVERALQDAIGLERRRRFLERTIDLTEEELRHMKHETGPYAEDEGGA
jgi:Arc/MetJ family transcription regulator